MSRHRNPIGVGLAALAVLALGSPALAREPLVLAPSTPWNLNYADDSCQLARGFGQGADQVILYLEQFSPGQHYNVRLIGKPFKSAGLHTNLRLWGNGGEPLSVPALSGTTGDKQPMLAFTADIAEFPERSLLPSSTLADKAAVAGRKAVSFAIVAPDRMDQIHIDPPGGAPTSFSASARWRNRSTQWAPA
jgi:hypothetical protein